MQRAQKYASMPAAALVGKIAVQVSFTPPNNIVKDNQQSSDCVGASMQAQHQHGQLQVASSLVDI